MIVVRFLRHGQTDGKTHKHRPTPCFIITKILPGYIGVYRGSLGKRYVNIEMLVHRAVVSRPARQYCFYYFYRLIFYV